LDKVTTYPLYGSILIVGSVIAGAYGIREHLRDAKAGWSGIVAAFIIVATWGAVAFDIYDRHYAGAISTQTADLRLAPFNDSTFFDSLPYDKSESFRMVCFSTDPSSCSIAARYESSFGIIGCRELLTFKTPSQISMVSMSWFHRMKIVQLALSN